MGHHNRHYAGDPHANAGVWSPPSSTANFCEEDYAISLWVAEFINSISNLAYIYFAMRYPRKAGPDMSSQPKFDLMAVSLFVLGINSFLFHATLRHTTQYADELSMLLLGGALMQGIFTIGRSPSTQTLITTAVWAIIAICSAVYVRTGNILHQVWSFNTIMLVVGIQTMWLVFGGTKSSAEKWRLMGLFGKACAVLIFGYTLWQIDLEMCFELRKLRARMGLPWAVLFELHGWWHVLTALGASLYIRLIRELSG